MDGKRLYVTTPQHSIPTFHMHIHIRGNTNSFLQNFLLMKNAKYIEQFCISFIAKNNYNMNIDIHVVDGDRFDINTLQQTV